jgi:hypothetical protein
MVGRGARAGGARAARVRRRRACGGARGGWQGFGAARARARGRRVYVCAPRGRGGRGRGRGGPRRRLRVRCYNDGRRAPRRVAARRRAPAQRAGRARARRGAAPQLAAARVVARPGPARPPAHVHQLGVLAGLLGLREGGVPGAVELFECRLSRLLCRKRQLLDGHVATARVGHDPAGARRGGRRARRGGRARRRRAATQGRAAGRKPTHGTARRAAWGGTGERSLVHPAEGEGVEDVPSGRVLHSGAGPLEGVLHAVVAHAGGVRCGVGGAARARVAIGAGGRLGRVAGVGVGAFGIEDPDAAVYRGRRARGRDL